MSSVRRFSDDEVHSIFRYLHGAGPPPPPDLTFTIIPPRPGQKLSPPSYEYKNGLYVLLPPLLKSKKIKSENRNNCKLVNDSSNYNDKNSKKGSDANVPPHLHHLVITNVPDETCPWNLSGPQFPKPTSLQQRYCYPRGSQAYSKCRAAALWTAYDTNGVEKTDFRLLHVYTSEKRANSNIVDDEPEDESNPTKCARQVVSGVSPAFSTLAHYDQLTDHRHLQHHYQYSYCPTDLCTLNGTDTEPQSGFRRKYPPRSPVPIKGRYVKLVPRHRPSTSRDFHGRSLLMSKLLVNDEPDVDVDMNRTEQQPHPDCSRQPSSGGGEDREYHDDKTCNAIVFKSGSDSSSLTEPTSNRQRHTTKTGIFRGKVKGGAGDDDEDDGLGNMSGLADLNFSTGFVATDFARHEGTADSSRSREAQERLSRHQPSYPYELIRESPNNYCYYHHDQQHHRKQKERPYPIQQQQQEQSRSALPSRVENCQQLERLLGSMHHNILASIRSVPISEQGQFLCIYSEWGKMLSQFPLTEYPRLASSGQSQQPENINVKRCVQPTVNPQKSPQYQEQQNPRVFYPRHSALQHGPSEGRSLSSHGSHQDAPPALRMPIKHEEEKPYHDSGDDDDDETLLISAVENVTEI